MKYYKKIKTERGTIAGRNILSLALLGIFLILGVCLMAGRLLYTRNNRIYTNFVYSYAHLIADNISGITPTKFMETQTKDEDYFDIRYTFMTAGIHEKEFRAFYLVIPTEDDLIYISEIYQNLPEGKEELSAGQAGFLEHRPYRPGEKEIMMQVLAEGPEAEKKLYRGLREFDGEKLATALVPLYTMENEIPALIGIDISVAAIWEAMMNMFIMLAVTIILITSIGIGVHYRVLERTLIQPIVTLKTGADELVGKLDSEEAFVSDIHTGDEIEALAHSVEEMDRSLKQKTRELVEITAEQERLNTELELASSIQMDMLPCIFPPFPDRSEFDIYASMKPAKEVGGDFYDFFLVDQDHLGLVIADVSGKGIPAALFMMRSKTAVRGMAGTGKSPAEIFALVNDMLCEGNEAEMFVTVWLGIIDLDTGHMVCANAGHEYPALMRRDERFELYKQRHSPALATMEGLPFREYELDLNPGDCLFVYTDGVPEAINVLEEDYKTGRLVEVLNHNRDLPLKELLPVVKKDIHEFAGEAEQFDDITMLGFRYLGR